MTAVRSVTPSTCKKLSTAATAAIPARTLRQTGSFVGFQLVLVSSGSGSWNSSVGKAGSAAGVPPQAVITSSAVMASGSRLRAIRLADVV